MKWTSLCNLTAILQGSWHFLSNPTKEFQAHSHNPWQQCPQTKQHVESTKGRFIDDISDHIRKYSCAHNHSYREAVLKPRGECSILSVEQSLSQLQAHTQSHLAVDAKPSPTGSLLPLSQNTHLHHTNPRQLLSASSHRHRRRHILFVGDSLSAQMFIAARCLTERHRTDLRFSFAPELFLRPDIPCDPHCIGHPDFFQNRSNELVNPCGGCPQGQLRPFEEYSLRSNFWANKVNNDTLAVLIGSGAWFNVYKGVLNSSSIYEDTLKLVSPLIHRMIHEKQIAVFWITLPPMISEGKRASFEWNLFREKNQQARALLAPLGVQILDVEKLFLARKTKDPSISADGSHWCNPGINSAPSFVSQVLFHLLAVNEINI